MARGVASAGPGGGEPMQPAAQRGIARGGMHCGEIAMSALGRLVSSRSAHADGPQSATVRQPTMDDAGVIAVAHSSSLT